MNSLREWLESHPVPERTAALERVGAEAGVTAAAVRHWVNGTRTIPAERVSAVAHVTGIARGALRPDVFGTAPAA